MKRLLVPALALSILTVACHNPLEEKKFKVEITAISYDATTGFAHVSTEPDEEVIENMEIVIPLGGNDRRIGVVKNVKNDDGGFFGSDIATFDVYLPADLKDDLLLSLSVGSKLDVRSANLPISDVLGASSKLNLDSYIQQFHLEKYKEQIKVLCETSYRLKPTPRLIASPGSSKIGGEPDLPAGVEWPQNEGKPMSFITQLDLSQFRQGAARMEGHLYLFMDLSQTDSSGGNVVYKLIHRPGKEKVKRVKYAEGFPADLMITENALRVSSTMMLPEDGSASVRKLALNDEDRDNYNMLRTMCVNMDLTDFFNGAEVSSEDHFMGYPSTHTDIQLYSEMDAQSKEWSEDTKANDSLAAVLTPAASKWRVLLQLDFDQLPLSTSNLSGKYYFMIRKSDLEKGKLENTRMYFEDYE